MSDATTRSDVLEALAAFRSRLASDLTLLTSCTEAHGQRAAGQEGLQLVWSFVVSNFDVTTDDEALLREAFPDELFGADPESHFVELRESVQDSYADGWKYMASDHLVRLAVACATFGETRAIAAYRDLALRVAALTCDLDQPMSGTSVAALGRFNGVLRRVIAITEVAIDQGAIPEADQVREFSARTSAHGSTSLDFLGLLELPLAHRLLAAFKEQFGTDAASELLEAARAEALSEAELANLAELSNGLT